MNFYLRFPYQDKLDSVKRPEKRFRKNIGMDVYVCIYVCMYVCMYVKTSQNSRFCIPGITESIKLKFGVHLKQTPPFLWYHFRCNYSWIGILWWFEFFKNVRKRSSCRNLWAILKKSTFKDDWDWIWKKSIEAFRFYVIFYFSKKGQFVDS